MTASTNRGSRHVSAYRALTRLYPSSFRREYRNDLVALFDEQMGTEAPNRVWARAVRDLAVTVPTQHLEARMSHSTDRTGTTVAMALAVATASLLAGLAISREGNVAVVLAFVALALSASLTALWSWRAGRGGLELRTGPIWWHFMAGGAAGMFLLIVVPELMSGGGEPPDGLWYLWFLLTLTSMASVGVGALLGLGRLVAAVRHARS